MTDLELLDEYCENCLSFIHPMLFRDVQARGLIHYVNYLPSNVDEAKAVVRARLAKDKKFYDNPEIDQVAGEIKRLEALKGKLNNTNIADAHKIAPILNEMQGITTFLLDYYKPVRFS